MRQFRSRLPRAWGDIGAGGFKRRGVWVDGVTTCAARLFSRWGGAARAGLKTGGPGAH